jgi:amidohydrolase
MNDSLAGRIRELAAVLDGRLREVRRQIHRHPELGYQERRTAALVAERLHQLGLEVQEGVCQTGVVALLKGATEGSTVALRADMDALPLEETADHPHRSANSGVMHACGHDAHVACLLGAAEILSKERSEVSPRNPADNPPDSLVGLPGSIKFIFQPSEEGLPSGALDMVRAGVLENPPVRALVALHVDPQLPAGHIGVRAGPFLAEARDFEVRIRGRSGHGAHPHEGIDALVMAAYFVTQVQTLVSRRVDPLVPAVVSIGQIQGGRTDNIIAEQVDLQGTVRCLDPATADRLVEELEAILAGITGSAGARYEIRWSQGCAALINDVDVVDAVRRAVLHLYGRESLHEDIPQSMGGDDVSYFLQHVPGALFVLGTNDGTEETSYPLHHPRFDIDESALTVGSAVMALTALELLFI